MKNDDGFMYPIGSIFVVETWLWMYMIKKNVIPTFEDYKK